MARNKNEFIRSRIYNLMKLYDFDLYEVKLNFNFYGKTLKVLNKMIKEEDILKFGKNDSANPKQYKH